MNEIIIAGKLETDPTYLYEIYGDKFFDFCIATQRDSDYEDVIRCVVPEDYLSGLCKDVLVTIRGEIRTRNYCDESKKTHCEVYVFVKETIEYGEYDDNKVTIDGFICKKPIYRETPLGREICDVLVASNRNCRKSDYIPCVAWGRNAKRISSKCVGTKIHIEGRLQSRIYVKDGEDRTAYEVSITRSEETEAGDDERKQ